MRVTLFFKFRGVLPGAARAAAEVLARKKKAGAMKKPAAAKLAAKRPAAAKQVTKRPAAAKLTPAAAQLKKIGLGFIRAWGLGSRVSGLGLFGFVGVLGYSLWV